MSLSAVMLTWKAQTDSLFLHKSHFGVYAFPLFVVSLIHKIVSPFIDPEAKSLGLGGSN